MSTNAEKTKSCPIPTRVMQLKDWSQLPDCYSQTPGGTLFSTTPGGTRIIYDRKFLLDCRNSPIARTPPCCLPQIPGVTVPSHHPLAKLQELKEEELEEDKGLTAHVKLRAMQRRNTEHRRKREKKITSSQATPFYPTPPNYVSLPGSINPLTY
ncbi:hypothetical protein NFI96_022352 [Prochilodus magdalenae]|nr:hypothetical protein NFI96_022352 [Prochilodus magdalenae]